MNNIHNEIITSTELIFRSRLTWLLIFGPVALIGKSGIFGESVCFILAGLTLIPLAERLSFVTEEVASHTNQTIGALLNATFGNAPELLISSAALQEGFYRVVQLTLLGSMLTNLLFVFGLSCLIGGLRFQVQELRIVSGNASIGMLMLAVAGLALPAALMLSDEMISVSEEKEYLDKNGDGKSDINDGPTYSMVGFSRFNAIIMIVGYLLYLLFQLGSHKDEFEDEDQDEEEGASMNGVNIGNNDEEGQQPIHHRSAKKVRKNMFCRRLLFKRCRGEEDNITNERGLYQHLSRLSSVREMEMSPRVQQSNNNNILSGSQSLPDYIRDGPRNGEGRDLPQSQSDLGDSRKSSRIADDEADTVQMSNVSNRRRKRGEETEQSASTKPIGNGLAFPDRTSNNGRRSTSNKSHCSDGSIEEEPYIMSVDVEMNGDSNEEGKIEMIFLAGVL